MSTTQQGSSGGGCSKRPPARNRRAWTKTEELTLIAAIKELISQGWKSKNGFKPRYLNRCEALLRKELPACDLKAMPHINSRLASWKKLYNSLSQVLSRSGVGFNTRGNHMIEVEDDQWEQILRVDPTLRGKRYAEWPYYDAWKDMFGRDRATGEHAEDLYEAYTTLQSQDGVHLDDPLQANAEQNYAPNGEGDSVSQSGTDLYEKSRGVRRKKQKAQFDVDPLCELLAEMNHATSSRLDKIVERIGYEFEKGQARQEVLSQLGQISCLTVADKFNLCEMIAFKSERLDIWRGMGSEERTQYVDHLLNGNGV